MRAHVVLDKELVDAIDEIAGKRKRSQFIEDAIRVQLALEKQTRALYAEGPGLDPREYPYWATPEATSKWVHDMRQADQAYLEERRAARQRERELESNEQ